MNSDVDCLSAVWPSCIHAKFHRNKQESSVKKILKYLYWPAFDPSRSLCSRGERLFTIAWVRQPAPVYFAIADGCVFGCLKIDKYWTVLDTFKFILKCDLYHMICTLWHCMFRNKVAICQKNTVESCIKIQCIFDAIISDDLVWYIFWVYKC